MLVPHTSVKYLIFVAGTCLSLWTGRTIAQEADFLKSELIETPVDDAVEPYLSDTTTYPQLTFLPVNVNSHRNYNAATPSATVHNFTWSKDAYIAAGAGIRSSYLGAEHAAPNGSWGNDFRVDNARIYLNGKGAENIGFELNTEIAYANYNAFVTQSGNTRIQLLDAIAKFGDGGAFNVWAGRMLPPADRAVLSGPFFLNTYDYPFVSNLPGIFAGRQDGFSAWGLVADDQLKYQVGIFDGVDPFAGNANPSDNIQFNARVTLNLLDPETGYYNQSTYYGEKNVLAIGAAVVTQNGAIYSATDGLSNFTAWTTDILSETVLSNGDVLTLSGAYYDYDTGVRTNDANANSVDGQAGIVTAGYLINTPVQLGCLTGRLRPVFRWQDYNRTFSAVSAANSAFSDGIDAELQYVLYGHNARISLSWGQRKFDAGETVNLVQLGTQLQF